MATKMIASVIKMSGDRRVAEALATAVVVPDVAMLMKDNQKLRAQLDEERQKRWRENAKKIQQWETALCKLREPRPWWHDVLMFIGAAVYVAVTGFVRLLVVKEEE